MGVVVHLKQYVNNVGILENTDATAENGENEKPKVNKLVENRIYLFLVFICTRLHR